jgi:hypothetical protein
MRAERITRNKPKCRDKAGKYAEAAGRHIPTGAMAAAMVYDAFEERNIRVDESGSLQLCAFD